MKIRATWRCKPAFRVALSEVILVLQEGNIYDVSEEDAKVLMAMGWGEPVLAVPEDGQTAPETTTSTVSKRRR